MRTPEIDFVPLGARGLRLRSGCLAFPDNVHQSHTCMELQSIFNIGHLDMLRAMPATKWEGYLEACCHVSRCSAAIAMLDALGSRVFQKISQDTVSNR